MAPSISINAASPASWAASATNKKKSSAGGGVDEAELLRRRNEELEREVAALRLELSAARRRAETAEEAEERLCVQLGDAEVEALELVRAYQAQVQALAAELANAARGVATASR